ncbi:MAG: hypothetical protein Q8S73_40030 [Deltaproteobacteria bacterium]|nr:hypothetical protein [Myxococcales bacterium]MDP3220355.1 hypothetical protein [Deltaproteobacteria bacterium]
MPTDEFETLHASPDGVLRILSWCTDGADFADERRSAWVEVFKEWRTIVDEYTDVTGDPAYWNHEIANVSFLSAAVWRVRMVAVQEFHAPRTADRGLPRGRADLWARIGGTSYLLEAKVVFLPLDSRTAVADVAYELTTAVAEARDYQDTHEFCGGIVFGIPNSPRPGDFPARISAWRSSPRAELTKVAPHGIVVDYFPPKGANILKPNNDYYPGVTIVLGFAPAPTT